MKKTIVTVFGNEIEASDRLAIQLIPHLTNAFPEIAFIAQDPTEIVEPAGDPWVILDVAIGIHEGVVVRDLDQLEYVKGQSVHDFDVYMELRLRKKIGQIGNVAILLLPNDWTVEQAKPEAIHLLQHVLEESH